MFFLVRMGHGPYDEQDDACSSLRDACNAEGVLESLRNLRAAAPVENDLAGAHPLHDVQTAEVRAVPLRNVCDLRRSWFRSLVASERGCGGQATLHEVWVEELVAVLLVVEHEWTWDLGTH